MRHFAIDPADLARRNQGRPGASLQKAVETHQMNKDFIRQAGGRPDVGEPQGGGGRPEHIPTLSPAEPADLEAPR